MPKRKTRPKPIGRPSLYTPALLKRARGYLRNFGRDGSVIPSHRGLARYLNISRDTLYDWRRQEDKWEFSFIMERVMLVQHELLVSNGLSGKFNANITKLLLTKHGYTFHNKTKSAVKINVKLSSLSEAELDRRIQQLEREVLALEHG